VTAAEITTPSEPEPCRRELVKKPQPTRDGWLTQLGERILAWYWSKRLGPIDAHPVQVGGFAPSDNVQLTMNLVMPLRSTTAVGRARAMQAIGASIDELFTGLDNVGTVHFARFDIIDGNLCMLSVYDADPRAYIRDFIAMFGGVFDALMQFVEDPPATPTDQNVEEFLDWVGKHDAFHIPGGVSAMFPHLDSVAEVERDLVRMMHANKNVQLGIYRGYAGYSAAQIRWKVGMGW